MIPSGKTGHQRVTCDAEQIDWQPRKHPVANIQSLRHDVEREGDEAFVGGTDLPSVLEGSRQQLVTNAAALLTGCDEQFCQKPQVDTYPTHCETDDLPVGLGHHKPSGSSLRENN